MITREPISRPASPAAPAASRDLKRILVSMDYSRCAETALDYAMRLARVSGADLHVIHVASGAESDTLSPLKYSPDVLARNVTIEDILRERLAATIGRYDQGDVLTEVAMTKSYGVARRVLRYARAEGLGLIVMGTRGRGMVSHMMVPSVAEDVTWQTDVPVITVRGDVQIGTPPIRRILVPVDFSASSIPTLRLAVDLARIHQASIHLMHVVMTLPERSADDVIPPGNLTREVRQAVMDRLHGLIHEVGADHMGVHTYVEHGDPAEAIRWVSGGIDADLIMVASKRPSALRRLVRGSVSRFLIRKAECPVLSAPVEFGGE
jgi:nucleotide-binding universal stress UspA family protein